MEQEKEIVISDNTQEICNEDTITSQGKIFCTIVNEDGTSAKMVVRNKVVMSGRSALASSLANQISGDFNYYIAQVVFGSSGTVGGVPRFVNDNQAGLFGAVTLTKPVIATIDPNFPSAVTFTTTIAFGDLPGGAIVNEIALIMGNGQLFSMACFADLNKTNSTQFVFNWRLSFC
jgi:hypothetical protein